MFAFSAFSHHIALYLTPFSRISFKGQVNIAEYQGGMDVDVDVTKATAVLRIEPNSTNST